VQVVDVKLVIAEHREQRDVAEGVDGHVPSAGARDRLPERSLPGEAGDLPGGAEAGGGVAGEGLRVNSRVGTGAQVGRCELAVEGGHQGAGNPRDPFSQAAHFGDKSLPVHLRSVLTGGRSS
jgi:hypothetical protein